MIVVPEERMRHMFGVASKCYELALEQTNDELFARRMYFMGLIHDIGRSFDNDNHEQAGAEILDTISFGEFKDIISAIRYHGTIRNEMSPIEKLLKQADLSIDGNGNEVTFEERLKDIENRYGKNTTKYERVKEQIEIISETLKI